MESVSDGLVGQSLGKPPSKPSLQVSGRFRRADRVRKRSSCWVVFFGRPLLGLSLTSPVSRNFASVLEMVLGLTPNRAATLFWGVPASIWPIARAFSTFDKRGILKHYRRATHEK